MKTRYLFPHKYKIFGWIILLIGLILGIVLLNFDLDAPNLTTKVLALFGSDEIFIMGRENSLFINNNIADEIASLFIIIGGLLVAFSKIKSEDEYSSKIRTESLIWATYVNYSILIVSIIFVYNSPFFRIMIYNMFTILLFFILRFHFVLYKTKKLLSDEE